MKLAVVGTGYVGLVTGTCFAESGNDVVCIDKVAEKIERLRRGELPIYEPGLAELVGRNRQMGRLKFATSLEEGVADARLVFVAVGTPQADDGSADLSNLWELLDELGGCLCDDQIVVIKSTVPVGTSAAAARRLCERAGWAVDVASNP